MNYLEYEDTAQFEVAHTRLDAAGKLARDRFPKGCLLKFENGQYHQQCPVALAHNRVGMSVGMKIRAMECSICGGDPDECEHIRGREYNGQRCIHRITDAEIMEVSFVAQPAQPDARIESVSISTSELRDKHGDGFRAGMPVTCDNCLSACGGVHQFFAGH
ncbi:hypothetical protein [Amycolatopsis sp. H20-H5]|uniref:hypothetical protein n=1 Tax=Amycolatopsis sp. H20-H5 TaxID=3046309 RepID=UPI002DBC7FAF|nr:hypothetical protein [Amycolatopsis sp. H20-H5]MEC3980419.1 hypothetical protein [Amycolatopsis sp. H20-H5]